MNGRLDKRIITHPHSEVYCWYFRRLVFGNSLTFSHIPPCFHASVAIVHMGLYTSDIGGGGGSILCTKQFVGSDSVIRRSPWEIAAFTGGGLLW